MFRIQRALLLHIKYQNCQSKIVSVQLLILVQRRWMNKCTASGYEAFCDVLTVHNVFCLHYYLCSIQVIMLTQAIKSYYLAVVIETFL